MVSRQDYRRMREAIEAGLDIAHSRKKTDKDAVRERENALDQVEHALWKRYIAQTKRQIMYAAWLDGRKLEDTFKTGGLSTRQEWVAPLMRSARSPFLQTVQTPDDPDWALHGLRNRINKRQSYSGLHVDVLPDVTSSEKYPQSPTVRFSTMRVDAERSKD
jgi:hypothetical protein